MKMPEPGPEHRRLEALAGSWTGDEILHPAPWLPERRTATGRFECRMGVDGFFLINDYVQEREGRTIFRGHGVYGYDPDRGRYTMHWFDSMGGGGYREPPLGVFEDDVLRFEAETPQGRARYTYTIVDADTFEFRIEGSADGKTWIPFMEGRYRRS